LAGAVILLTGFGTIESAVEAIRLGAFDYLSKPVIDDELEFTIQRALGQRRIIEENKQLKAQLDQRFGLGNIIGRDYKMVKMFDLIESVADTRTTVLILGESGTGKTLLARAIHQLSTRREKPFVEVACGALPDTLLESELFGHVAGSFTGAMHDKIGKFLQADGGTIFLDEVATASPSLQVKLLRVLQDREFEPVGGNKTHKVDIRLILATNTDLEERVAAGEFRQDLYYRINVITLMQPPLRERIGDIPLLLEHYLAEFRKQTDKTVAGFQEQTVQMLQRYHWPGNVRELENVVERAVVLCKGSELTADDLPPTLRGPRPRERSPGALIPGATLYEIEREAILRTLEMVGGSTSRAAEILGISVRKIQYRLKEYAAGGRDARERDDDTGEESAAD
jgi:DNA-binding NtrC family response regulator